MALPTAKRPKEVEVELQEEFAKKRREELKLLADPHTTFVDSMKKWYNDLKPKEKSRLTPKQLKRKAVSYCFPRKLVYDDLPLDWVKRLQDECGLKFYIEQKKTLRAADEDEDYSVAEKAVSGSDCTSPSSPASSDSSMFEEVFESEGKSGDTDDADKDEDAGDSDRAPKKVDKRNTKKFVDLTKEPPPPEWMRAFAEGTRMPRVLNTYSTEDTNMLFWDYSPKLVDRDGNEVKLAPVPRTDPNEILLEGSASKIQDPLTYAARLFNAK